MGLMRRVCPVAVAVPHGSPRPPHTHTHVLPCGVCAYGLCYLCGAARAPRLVSGLHGSFAIVEIFDIYMLIYMRSETHPRGGASEGDSG